MRFLSLLTAASAVFIGHGQTIACHVTGEAFVEETVQVAQVWYGSVQVLGLDSAETHKWARHDGAFVDRVLDDSGVSVEQCVPAPLLTNRLQIDAEPRAALTHDFERFRDALLNAFHPDHELQLNWGEPGGWQHLIGQSESIVYLPNPRDPGNLLAEHHLQRFVVAAHELNATLQLPEPSSAMLAGAAIAGLLLKRCRG